MGPPNYSINELTIPNTQCNHDLGVLVDKKLTFGSHVDKITKNAYYAISVLFKCFVVNDIHALIKCYTAIVRPLLEYICTVWCPSLDHQSSLACLSHIDQIESVQRFFTRKLFFRCGLPASSYKARLNCLNFRTSRT